MNKSSILQEALSYCAQYLGGTWECVASSDVISKRIRRGVSNVLLYLKLADYFSHENQEVIVRFYGSELTGKGNKYKLLSEVEEAIVFQTLSEMLSGPKLLGLFPGGRIEEFICVEQVSVEEYESIEVCSFLAKQIAKFHCLRFPIKKCHKPSSEQVKSLYQAFCANQTESSHKNEIYLRYFKNFDFGNEVKWIEKMSKSTVVASRIVFSHCDLNRTNIVKRDNTNEYLIFDFEYCRYTDRAADMSTYFIEIGLNHLQMCDEFDISCYPNEDFKKLFIRQYLSEFKQNFSDFDFFIDHEDRILLETDFSLLVICLIRILWILTQCKISKRLW
ncbi:choline/ethanolamine kinase-like isoform X2, partial [Dinothrombium tinctorium]